MPQKPLDISTSLFYPRAEEQQASLPGEQPYDADAARIHKSVRVCSHMVHQKDTSQEVAGYFLLLFSGKQELGAPLVARRARVFQAVKKTLVGASIARPCPFVCETTSPENALLHQVSGRPMVAPTHSMGQEYDFLTR